MIVCTYASLVMQLRIIQHLLARKQRTLKGAKRGHEDRSVCVLPASQCICYNAPE
jgi:hypothetical protein